MGGWSLLLMDRWLKEKGRSQADVSDTLSLKPRDLC